MRKNKMFLYLQKLRHKYIRKNKEEIYSKDYLSQKIIPIPFLAKDSAEVVQNLDQCRDSLEKIPGALDYVEGLTMLTLSAYSSGIEPIIEVGSYLGKSTSYLALGSKISGKGEVYAIDLFPGPEDWYKGKDGYYHIYGSNYYLSEDIYFQRSSFIYGGGYKTMLELFNGIIQKVGLQDTIIPFKGTSSTFAESIPQGKKFRMIFIDGDHTYEGVSNDISSSIDLLKEGGILCFHDYCNEFPGVVEAVNKHIISSKKFSNFSVVKSLFIAKKNNMIK